MEATVNKQAAIDGYAAFSAMDAEAAEPAGHLRLRRVGGRVVHALAGTYRGPDEVGGLWTKFLEKGFDRAEGVPRRGRQGRRHLRRRLR